MHSGVVWFDRACDERPMYRKPFLLRLHTETAHHVVTEASVEAFLRRWMKPQRLNNGTVPIAQKVATYTAELEQLGYCFITRHDSMTGLEVYYVPTALARLEGDYHGDIC